MKPRKNKITLVILAAGVGSRYGGLKQLDAVGPFEQSILDYSIYDALQAGFDRLVFVIRKDIKAPCQEFISERYENQVKCELVFQEIDALPQGFEVPQGRVKPWGTGHAVLVCEPVVDDLFCVINADDFYGRAAFVEMANFFKNADINSFPHEFAMVAFKLKNTLSAHGAVSRGVCEVSSAGQLISVTERTSISRKYDGIAYKDENGASHVLSGDEPVSLNFWGFGPGFFLHLREQFSQFLKTSGEELKSEFFLPGAVDQLIQERKAVVTILNSPDRWVGVTYKPDKAQVMSHIKALVDKGEYPEKLW